LDSIDEFAHYMVIAGYVHYLFKSPTILDVGCGQGRLAELLAAFSITRYLGVDLSAEAIRHARRRIRPPARFRVADLNAWHPPGRFSVIVFCESLNYASHPVSTLVRYARALEPDGAIIVSLLRHRNHGRIWKNAARYFRTADSTTVINPKGATWDIRVLRPMR
jgi:trans-aconitate methyltransferase